MKNLMIPALALFLSAAAQADDSPLWMRYCAISPDGQTIAFSYQGDIYTVPSSGGKARQLTTHPAHDTRPGTPISMVVYNKTQRSKDYSEIAKYYRPGHADYTFDEKFGFRDYRGGGRSSGRETIGRVAAGAIACEALKQLGVNVMAYSKAIGGIEADTTDVSFDKIMESPLYMPDIAASHKAEKLLEEKMNEQDSVGGIIECVISGIPTGVGEPVFEKLDANLAKAVMSIGAVKGVEIGAGFEAASMYGSDNNDAFKMDGENVSKKTNNAGGILGGISDGSNIVLRAAVKPTPSIARSQETVNRDGEDIEVQIKGRHDPIIVPRAVVVVESMAAICAFDMLLESMTSKMYGLVTGLQPQL